MKVIDSPVTGNVWLSFFPNKAIPEGFESAAQIASKVNYGMTQTKIWLRKSAKEGKLDVFIGLNGAKFYRPVDYAKTQGKQPGQKHRSHR